MKDAAKTSDNTPGDNQADQCEPVAEETSLPPLQRQLGGRLSTRAMNFGIPTNQGTQMHAHDKHGADSWRYRVLKMLHSTKVQILFMVLLLLDVSIIFVEISLLAAYPPCDTIVRDAISCCPSAEEAAVDHTERFLEDGSQGHDDGHDFCGAGLEPSLEYEAGCDPHKWERVHTAEEVMFALTVTILALFFIELNTTMVALGPGIFFRQFFFLMDYVIVSVSLALELTFHILNDTVLASLVGLLVAARVWRFIRIGHGIVEVTNELAQRPFENLLTYTEELEELLRENNIEVPDSEKIRSVKGEHNGDTLISKIEREHRVKHRSKHQYILKNSAASSENDDGGSSRYDDDGGGVFASSKIP